MDADEEAGVFQALADSTRRQIREELRPGELSAGKIAARFPISICLIRLARVRPGLGPGRVRPAQRERRSSYSATRGRRRLEGVELNAARWVVEPVGARAVSSSFFDDPGGFPRAARSSTAPC